MMNNKNIKIAIICGEVSGDLLAASLIEELKQNIKADVSLCGIGGENLAKFGLKSFFPMEKISLIGIKEILLKIPVLLFYIFTLARYIIREHPDILLLVDSPDFTHRVARLVKKINKNIFIVQYIAPTVWAWRERRAVLMKKYIDFLFVIFPFEVQVLQKLSGPDSLYVGHPLFNNKQLCEIYNQKLEFELIAQNDEKSEKIDYILILPGSRRSEVLKLLPVFLESIKQSQLAVPVCIITLPHLQTIVEDITAEYHLNIAEIVVDQERKFELYKKSCVALAANGTICLELAMARIAMISSYKLDFLANWLIKPFLKIWSGVLVNIILDKAVIPEFYNEFAEPKILSKQLLNLVIVKEYREIQLRSFSELYAKMKLDNFKVNPAVDYIKRKLDLH